jgi:hypothetical protein
MCFANGRAASASRARLRRTGDPLLLRLLLLLLPLRKTLSDCRSLPSGHPHHRPEFRAPMQRAFRTGGQHHHRRLSFLFSLPD